MFKVNIEKQEGNFAQIAIEPLEVGFGHTLGNALRRVLLTALEGGAITSVKIDGVSHQFSTLEGVLEDTIQIILNIKKIRINVGSTGAKLKIKATGKKVITAGDLEVEGDAQVANPDQHLVTLTSEKSKFNMELTAVKGRGYSLADERKTNELEVMSIDALFTPVVSVNYTVEPTRVGRRTDFDKLNLDITTDGTITSIEAVNEAARILSENFRRIYDPVVEEEVESTVPTISEEVLKMTVEELDLPVRITNALRAIDIVTVEDLINMPRQTLLKAKNLGTKSLSLISEKLVERGLSLSEA